VERAVEELSIDEPIDARHQYGRAPESHPDVLFRQREFQSDGVEAIRVNPLCEEPHPAAIRAVKRFGLVGLVACALAAAGARWWKSLPR
jgi:hypothetical protein